MTPPEVRALALVDAARMYVAAIEHERQHWEHTCAVAQAMGSDITTDAIYEGPNTNDTQDGRGLTYDELKALYHQRKN